MVTFLSTQHRAYRWIGLLLWLTLACPRPVEVYDAATNAAATDVAGEDSTTADVCTTPSYPDDCQQVQAFESQFSAYCENNTLFAEWSEMSFCGSSQSHSFTCNTQCPAGCELGTILGQPQDGQQFVANYCYPSCDRAGQCPTNSHCNLSSETCDCDTHFERCGTRCCHNSGQLVTGGGDVGHLNKIVSDSGNNPHLLFVDSTAQSLKYAYRNDGSWAFEVVASGEVAATALAIDNTNAVHTLFARGQQLHYSVRSGSGWVEEQLATDGSDHLGLAVSSNRLPQIVYRNSSGALHYLRSDGSTWIDGIVDAQGDVGEYCSLQLDRSDLPRVTYYDRDLGNLKYALHDGASWNISVVDSGHHAGTFSALAIDNQNQPHVVYYGANNLLTYAYYEGNRWQYANISGPVWATTYPSLRLDSQNRPHVGHNDIVDPAHAYVSYSHHNGSQWQTETIANAGANGFALSLTLDNQQSVHMSFHSGGSLFYAKLDEG